MATSIQQRIFLSLDTLMTQTLRGDTSPRTIDRQLPAVITPRTSARLESLAPAVDQFPPD